MPPAASPKPAVGNEVGVHWFRHGLRFHDNPSLLECTKNCREFYPVFIFDGEVAGTIDAGYNRMRFLLESLKDLDNSLKKVGGRLYVFHGHPAKIFAKIFEEWGVTRLSFEVDPEPIWTARDNAVRNLCLERNVQCIEKVSHTLWDPREIMEKNGGTPPLTFMLFNLVASTIGEPPKPTEDVDFSTMTIPVAHDHDNRFAIPTLEKLGVYPECVEQNNRINEWIGGETRALELMDIRLMAEEKAFRSGYLMPNQYKPDLLGEPLSLSAHLRFGCLSVRKFYWELQKSYERARPGERPPISMCAQLIWREYFYTMSVNNINYNKMIDNPICLNIPWYNDKDILKKWEMGQTGYPWIDACMNQLRQEGWIHHVGRHAVSCFLTRGDLWIDWQDGLRIFYKYLLDADWSVCAGNWMWVSSSAFEKVLQCPRCFCPVRYGKRMDPSGEYIRRYIPALKEMPTRYIYEPWKAPKSIQEKAKCIIGVDYPTRIVDHDKASKQNAKKMKEIADALTGKEIPHCAPANEDEVKTFVWVPDHQPKGGHCDPNFLVGELEEL